MLYIDDKQVNPEDLMLSMEGMTKQKYNRIISHPTFQLDESKILKKRTVNSPLAKKTTYGILTSFWFRDKDGLQKRLRYAQTQIPEQKGGIMTYRYEPHRLNVDGQTVAFMNAPDKAVFMYLNPGNPSSPFADKTKKKFAFMDKQEQTIKDAADMSNIQKALTHATQMEEEELVIVAKGLKLLLSDDYDLAELRVRLQQYAINPATNRHYIRAMEDDMVRIEGRIRNLVDKKVFKLQTKGSTRQWVWEEGARKGEYIGDSIMNPNEDALQRLFNYIKANLGDYLFDLRNSTDIIAADRKAREVLAAEKQVTVVPEHLAAVNQEMPVGLTLKDRITTFDQFRDYVGEKGFPKNSKLIKELMTAVQEGAVTDDNVNNFLAKLFEK